MNLNLRWVGDDERDRVAETRMLCYAPARGELASYVDKIRTDQRAGAGDWLLAEDASGRAIGTATSLALTMWVRGGPVACQGVATVGTIRTHRRRSVVADDDGATGVATAIMRETLRAAREREFVLSALMPFRGSFYESFGYGFVERRAEWSLPMAVLPRGRVSGDLRFYEPGDFDELLRFRQRLTQRTHGDIERSTHVWEQHVRHAEQGHMVVERAGTGSAGGPIRSFLYFEQSFRNQLDTVRVQEALYEDTAGLVRQLTFLGTLRDQCANALITLPADFRLNWLLRETQMTHRDRRNHPTPECRPYTRMQVRVLDHAKLLAAMKLAPDHAGKCVVAIRESEGHVTKLTIEVQDGRASAAPSDASAEIEMPDRVWAAVALGDLPATRAAELGLVDVTNAASLGILDAFAAAGPAPFCREYF